MSEKLLIFVSMSNDMIKKMNELRPSYEDLLEVYRKNVLIAEIAKHHPGGWTQTGLSWYTGGFVDDGGWFENKLKELSEKELIDFLEKLEENERQNQKRFAEEERVHKLPKEQRDKIYQAEQDGQIQEILDRHPEWSYLREELLKMLKGIRSEKN